MAWLCELGGQQAISLHLNYLSSHCQLSLLDQIMHPCLYKTTTDLLHLAYSLYFVFLFLIFSSSCVATPPDTNQPAGRPLRHQLVAGFVLPTLTGRLRLLLPGRLPVVHGKEHKAWSDGATAAQLFSATPLTTKTIVGFVFSFRSRQYIPLSMGVSGIETNSSHISLFLTSL